MKPNFRLTISFIFSVFVFYSCDLNDSNDSEFSRSVYYDGISVLVKDGTLDSPGEIQIVNNSNHIIYLIKTLYPYCNFSNYNLMKKNNAELEPLTYDEFQNIWIKNNTPDSIVIACEMYLSPIKIKPQSIFKQNLSNVYESGEFQLQINYRYSEQYNPTSPDKNILIQYFVK